MNSPTAQDTGPLHHYFEKLYRHYNRPEFIHPDPLEFVLRFKEPDDQEIAGLVASGLAYGRVGSVLKNLGKIFKILGRPSVSLKSSGSLELKDAFSSFRHRWTKGEEVFHLLEGVRLLREEYGSLQKCFIQDLSGDDETVVPAAINFVKRLQLASGQRASSLLACPSMGSACKRFFLYLRWMVRCDEVDPGPWTSVPASKLVVPMDVHMHRFSRHLGLTRSRQADLKCALQITRFFKGLEPEDPVKYDFALTRPGIRSHLEPEGISGTVKAKDVHL